MSEQDLLNLLNLGQGAQTDTAADGFDVGAFLRQFQDSETEGF